MTLTFWKRAIGLAALTSAAMIMAASCGDNGGAGGSGAAPGSDCSIGKEKCQLGCEPNLGCVGCASGDDCGAAAPICVLGSCSECALSTDCSGGLVCYPRAHTCEAKCTSDADCESVEPICDVETGACVGCRTDADCPDAEKPICEPQRGDSLPVPTRPSISASARSSSTSTSTRSRGGSSTRTASRTWCGSTPGST